jgi:hypothetical protein
MSILSIDSKVDELLDYVSNSDNLSIDKLLAAKVAFQLSRLSLGLQFIRRTQKLFSNQELIEDRLLSPDMINQLSTR